MANKGVTLKGSCLCGDVKYRTAGPLLRTRASHSVACRKWSGHYWASFTIHQDDLVLEQGQESLAWYPAQGVERGFCVICGASLFARRENGDEGQVAVALGTVDGPTTLALDEHIFLGDKGDYYAAPDDAPHFDGDSAASKV